MNKKVWIIAVGILCFISNMTLGMTKQVLMLNHIQGWLIATSQFSAMIFGITLTYLWVELFFPMIKGYLNKADKIKNKNGIL